MMYEWTGISLRYQKLFFAGIPLEDHRKLSEYKVYDDCTINVVRIRGGGDSVANSGIRSRGYMSDLELDHFGYLLDKIARTFREGGSPHQEVLIPLSVFGTNFSSFNIFLIDGKIICYPPVKPFVPIFRYFILNLHI